VIPLMRGVQEASCEEYVEGEEFTFDTVCVEGKPVYENIAAYLPKPIEMRSLEWISPVIITVRDMYQPRLMPGVELGRNVLGALGMGDRLHAHGVVSHPEGRGGLRRDRVPPGRRAHRRPDELHLGHRPVSRVGARGVLGRLRGDDGAQVQRRASSSSAPRARGASPASRASGLAARGREVVRRGAAPAARHERRNWKQTLLSDGHVMVRHPDWDEAYRLSFAAATGIKMYAE
jgi:hypothetical protein